MRLLVMFDLPVETSEDRKAYRHFRKALLNEGFLMIQYSVYVRVCVSKQSAQFIENRIAGFTPPAVQVVQKCIPNSLLECPAHKRPLNLAMINTN